ncbi:MAG: hypothetical protein JWP04_1045, partial [Belnapia sp.]|nr:hypothetical protein [Belnapia sp.]
MPASRLTPGWTAHSFRPMPKAVSDPPTEALAAPEAIPGDPPRPLRPADRARAERAAR